MLDTKHCMQAIGVLHLQVGSVTYTPLPFTVHNFLVFCTHVGSPEVVWPDLQTSIFPAYCSYVGLLPDVPCTEDIMFILQVGLVYPCT